MGKMFEDFYATLDASKSFYLAHKGSSSPIASGSNNGSTNNVSFSNTNTTVRYGINSKPLTNSVPPTRKSNLR